MHFVNGEGLAFSVGGLILMYRQELHKLLTLLYEVLPHSMQGINSLRIGFEGGFNIPGGSF